jgi:outer membrane cobalamin receptor
MVSGAALIAFMGPAVSFGADATADLTQLDLQTLMNLPVYAASRFEQTESEAPSSVSIVTSDEIKRYGYRTIDDVLRSIRGFYVTDDRNYSHVGARGFNRPGDYNTRILFLVDGHRINDSVYDSALLGTAFPVHIDLIDRIEVIRGPSSSLYGTNAFFGVINIITRGTKDLAGVEVSGSAASFGTYDGRMSYGQEFQNSARLLLSSSVYESEGQRNLYFPEYDAPATNNGIAGKVDGDTRRDAFAKIEYQGFTLEGVWASRKKIIPTGSYGTVFNDPDNSTIDERSYAALSYDRKIARDNDFHAQASLDRYAYSGNYVYALNTNKDEGLGEWRGGEVQLTNKTFNLHTITVGATYRDNYKLRQTNYYIGTPSSLVLLDDRRSSVSAYYIQDEFRLSDTLILNGGVRLDHYSTFGDTTNPRLAVIYKPFKQSVIKALYGEAFRAPTVYELYYNDGSVTSKPSGNLSPEKIRTYELDYEQQYGETMRSVISAYRYFINDLISQYIDPADGLIVFKNIDKVEANGVELELERIWDNGVRGRASYAFQRAKDRSTGQTLTNSPEQLGKLNITAPFFRDILDLSLEEQYVSSRTTLSNARIDGYAITNATLLFPNLGRNLALSISAYNAFNTRYFDPGTQEHLQDKIEQAGRSVRVKATYSF